MLVREEKSKINKLIEQGFSNYKISKLTGHSPNTVKSIRDKYQKSKVNREHIIENYYKNPSEKIRDFINLLKNIIQTEQVKAEEKKEIEELIRQLEYLLRTEVDERILEEILKAIEENNRKWRLLISNNYVLRVDFENLKKIIEDLKKTISRLNQEIESKNDAISNLEDEKATLESSHHKDKIYYHNQIRELSNENKEQSEFIEKHLDDAGRREREKLMHKEKDFERNVQNRQSILYNWHSEIEKRQKAVEKREREVTKREEKLQKKQEELDKTLKTISEIKNNQKKWQEEIDNQRENIKKGWGVVLKTAEEQRTDERRLQQWQINLENTGGFNKFSLPCPGCGKPMLFDINNKEYYKKINEIFGNYMHFECIKKKQQKDAISRPILSSGEPIIQSGFSPTIQSSREIMMAKPITEPIVKSGYPILQSGEQVKLVIADAAPVLQSGFFDSYCSGLVNFDKNSKGSKVSS